MRGPDKGPIDFGDLNAALLDRAETLVPQWLPAGRRAGKEWVCGDLSGGAGRSCSVNLGNGCWKDFSTDEAGGDLTSLYAAIHNLGQGQAARQLMLDLGWQQHHATPATPARSTAEPPPWTDADGAPTDGGAAPVAAVPVDGAPADAGAVATGASAKPAARKSIWRALVPVPVHAPPPTFQHWHYTEPEGTWKYRLGDVLYGHVVRFRNSEGGKEIMPHTWCVDESDDRGTQRWHWKQWDEPRPLYVPAGALSPLDAALPVALVEGEKCAHAGFSLLAAEFDFVSWPGGGNAWAKADWRWIAGRVVYLWPDCDAKRERLTRAEREANADPASKPLLPANKQPGMAAMVNIGTLLAAEHGCTVYLCPVPAPGAVSDGWDVADAVAQGWGATELRGFIRGAHEFVSPAATGAAPNVVQLRVVGGAGRGGGGQGTPPDGPAGAGGSGGRPPTWRDALLYGAKEAIKPVRENVVLALDGLPAEQMPGIEEACGAIAFNEFTNDITKRKATPWGTPPGAWDEVDSLLMGEWLTRQHWLPSMPHATLEEAVRMVGYRHRYHPVRAEFESLRGTWDGTARLRSWLRRCCLEEDEWNDADPLQQYLARVGTWLVMAICARVMTPGCKFDYMVIFEGPQGIGKSTLASVLGGEYFADTGLVLGDKDSYQNLQGKSVYEMGELDALSRSEVTKVKQFISSKVDRFRASFDRRAKDYPRQVVFVGTTNEDHYLTDPTGNRRFWPVRVTRQVDIAWLREHRGQLFAEALQLLTDGKRFHPTPREQRELFEAQQAQRAVENAIESAIGRYLYDDRQRLGANGENGTMVDEISVVELLGRVGIGLEKLGPGRFHERQATAALRRLGWVEARSSQPGRPRVYRRPPPAPPAPPPPPTPTTSTTTPPAAEGPPAGGAGSGSNDSSQGRQDAGAPPAGADSDCPF